MRRFNLSVCRLKRKSRFTGLPVRPPHGYLHPTQRYLVYSERNDLQRLRTYRSWSFQPLLMNSHLCTEKFGYFRCQLDRLAVSVAHVAGYDSDHSFVESDQWKTSRRLHQGRIHMLRRKIDRRARLLADALALYHLHRHQSCFQYYFASFAQAGLCPAGLYGPQGSFLTRSPWLEPNLILPSAGDCPHHVLFVFYPMAASEAFYLQRLYDCRPRRPALGTRSLSLF